MSTAQEKATVLAKTNLKTKDIQILMECGQQKALKIAQEFRSWFAEEKGYPLYGKQIPTEHFITYAGINEDRILKYAKQGF